VKPSHDQAPHGDADARFVAYLDALAADIDDPDRGEECRAILNDSPEQQRADFDLAEAMCAAGPAPTLVQFAVLTALLLVAVVAGIVVGRWW